MKFVVMAESQSEFDAWAASQKEAAVEPEADSKAAEGQDVVRLTHDRIDAMTWEQFEAEVLNSLPRADGARLDEHEWDAMKERVRDYFLRVLQ
jgi:hypothetical protein